MTTVKDGLFQYGGLPVGNGMIPITGIASDGVSAPRAFFVHGYLGNDGNSGLSPKSPLKTVTTAYGLCEDGRGDTVYILNDGTSTASVRDAALTWAKDNTHLIGLCAPAMVNQRARIAPPTTSTVDVDAYTPYLTLSASGCIFSNLSWFQGQSENKASVGVLVSGSRNVFNNVGIITGAHATQAGNVCYQLQLSGSENLFDNCYIGTDTVSYGNVASSNVCFGTSASSAAEVTRTVFRNCIFPKFATGAAQLFVTVLGLTEISRWNLFEDCNFINTGTSTMTQGVNVPGSTTGRLFFKDCAFFGCTDVTAANNALVQLSGSAEGNAANTSLYGTATIS